MRKDLDKLEHKSVSVAAINVVQNDLEKVQNQIENFDENQTDVFVEYQRLKLQTSDNFKIISREMKNIETDITQLKDLVSATFQLVVDQRYKVEKVM